MELFLNLELKFIPVSRHSSTLYLTPTAKSVIIKSLAKIA